MRISRPQLALPLSPALSVAFNAFIVERMPHATRSLSLATVQPLSARCVLCSWQSRLENGNSGGEEAAVGRSGAGTMLRIFDLARTGRSGPASFKQPTWDFVAL